MISQFRTAASALMSRMRWANMAGITFGGARDFYQLLGYKRTLGYWDYRDRYARDGVAKAVVEAYPNATWRGGVEVFEDEDPAVDTDFEKAFKDLDAQLGFWQTCQQVDILAGLSTFAVLLIGVSGGSNLTEELPKGQRLLFLKPFSGGGGEDLQHRGMNTTLDAAARVARYDVDPQSERFGEPASYYIRSQTPGSTFLNFEVHWSRVIHVAEGCLEDNVFGIPTLECVFNLFDDLAKITGGGAEAFWLRANQGLHLDVDKDMGMPGQTSAGLTPEARESLKDKAEELQHQLQRVLVTRGVTATQLGSDVANFGPSGDFLLKLIAGASRIPLRILVGSDRVGAELEQDAANFDSRVQDRRTGYAGPKIVKRTLDRLIKYGYLPTPAQYEVGWPVEENLDEKGKAAYAVSLASVNSTYGSVVFLDDEIRDMAFDLAPLTPAQKEAAKPEPAEVPEDDTDEDELRAAGDSEGHPFRGNQYTPGGAMVSHDTRKTLSGWQATAEFESGHIVEYGKVKGVTQSQHTGYQIRATLPDKLTSKEWKYSTKGPGTGQQEKMEKQLKKLGIAEPYRNDIRGLEAAEDAELLRILEAAIQADNVEVIAEIIGVRALGDLPGHEFHGNQFTDGGMSVDEAHAKIKEIDAKIRDVVERQVPGPNNAQNIKRRMALTKPLVAEQERLQNVLDPTRHQAIVASSKLEKRDGGGYAVKHGDKEIGVLEPVQYTGFKTVNSAQQMTKREGFRAKYGDEVVNTQGSRSESHEAIARAHSKKLRGLSATLLEDLGEHSYATTQLTLPADITESILALGHGIPDADLAADGRETDVHVTVKYGLINPDEGKLQSLLTAYVEARVYFGRTDYFETPDYDVVYVSVVGGNLADLNSAIASGMECAPSDHGAYVPHATVAYVKPGLGAKYAGLATLDGQSCTSQILTLVTADGERSEVSVV